VAQSGAFQATAQLHDGWSRASNTQAPCPAHPCSAVVSQSGREQSGPVNPWKHAQVGASLATVRVPLAEQMAPPVARHTGTAHSIPVHSGVH